jgi:hypothetical protein
MAKRQISLAYESKLHPSWVKAVSLLAAAGVVFFLWSRWIGALLLAIPALISAGVAAYRWLVFISARAYLGEHGAVGLLVYSNSPNWKEQIESTWIRRAAGRLYVLNWSDRRDWGRTPAVALFKTFAGAHDFNPLVIFVTRRRPLLLRFFPAFKNAKHGNAAGLAELEKQLFDELGRSTN